jgi:hypothetical protein
LPSVSKDKKKNGGAKKDLNSKEKGNIIDGSNKPDLKASTEAKDFKKGNKDVKSKGSDQQPGQSKNKKNLGKGAKPKGDTDNADPANQTELQGKEQKGPKNASKSKKSDKLKPDQKSKNESTKPAKSSEGSTNEVTGEESKKLEGVNKTRNTQNKKKNGKVKDPSSAADVSNKDGTNSIKSDKPAKSKRPEQQYYQPKQRVVTEDISNSIKGKDTVQRADDKQRKGQPPSLPADLSNMPTFNEQHAPQNENSSEIRSSDRGRGRGRGRGHSNRGRGRGSHGRGGGNNNVGSQSIQPS